MSVRVLSVWGLVCLGVWGFACLSLVCGVWCVGFRVEFRSSGVLVLIGRGWGLVGEVPREQKMIKGHLPRAIHHQAYKNTKMRGAGVLVLVGRVCD